jgi:hypothetical protein
MAQPGERGSHAGEQVGRAVAVLNTGAVNDAGDQQAAGVGKDVALPPLRLLAGVPRVGPKARPRTGYARGSAAFGSLDRLAVDDAGARSGLARRPREPP